MKNSEFITKNDFHFFQNEILVDLKKIETRSNEQFSQLSSFIKSQNFINEQKIQKLSALIETLTKKIEEKTDLEKFEDKLRQSMNTMNDTAVKLDIKLNILNKDLKDTCFKYDSIITNNLFVPRIIGIGCQFENLRYFIEYANTKISDLLKIKDKQNLDNKTYKEKIESLIKQNEIQLETMQIKMKDIIRQRVESSNNLFLQQINEVNNKIEKEKMDNKKYLEEQKIILDKIVNDFNKFYTDEFNDLFNNFNLNMDNNKEEFHHINNKIKELEEIIKKINFYQRKNSTKIINDNNEQNNIITNITNNNNDNKDLRGQKSIISSNFENANEKNYIKNNNTFQKNDSIKDLDNKDIENDISTNKGKTINKRKNLDNTNSNNLTLNKSLMANVKENDSLEVRNNSDNKFNDKDNENNKVNDITNYEGNNKRYENNSNKNKFVKVINYNGMNNEINKLNNNKISKNSRIGHNFSSNNMGYKTKYKKYFDFSDNIKVNTLVLGSEFSEKDLHFIKTVKFNLSQAYKIAKARLEEQQRLKLNMFSTLSVKGNDPVNNKIIFPHNYSKIIKNKIKEKVKTLDKTSYNFRRLLYDNQEIPNQNFPSINNDMLKGNNSSLDIKNMYLSYKNDNNGEKMPIFNKDANATQFDIANNNIIKIYKKNTRHRIPGSSSNDNHPVKIGSFTPQNISNSYFNYINNFDRSYDFSYEDGNSKETLKNVKSFLVKKFKEDND